MKMPREARRDLAQEMRTLAEAARDASRLLGRAPTAAKDAALRLAADALGARASRILAAN